jgi:hypothetical protein
MTPCRPRRAAFHPLWSAAPASVLGAVFALASGTSDIAAARPEAVASGMRTTFAVAATLIVVSLVFAMAGQPRAARTVSLGRVGGHPDPRDDDSRSGAQGGEDAPTLPIAFRAQAVKLASTSGMGTSQLAHERGISEQVRRDWLKRSDGDARCARRVGDGGAGFIPLLACSLPQDHVAGSQELCSGARFFR